MALKYCYGGCLKNKTVCEEFSIIITVHVIRNITVCPSFFNSIFSFGEFFLHCNWSILLLYCESVNLFLVNHLYCSISGFHCSLFNSNPIKCNWNMCLTNFRYVFPSVYLLLFVAINQQLKTVRYKNYMNSCNISMIVAVQFVGRLVLSRSVYCKHIMYFIVPYCPLPHPLDQQY